MRAWHVEAPGPVTGHPLRLHTEDDLPRPGPGELLLRVVACGVCRTDLHVTEGDLPPHRSRRDARPRGRRRGGRPRRGRRGLRHRGPRGSGLAPLDRRDLPLLPAERGEPVPALAVHRLGRRRRVRRVHDGARRLRAPPAAGVHRRRTGPAAVRGHHRVSRPAAGRTAARRPPGPVRLRRQRAPGRPGGPGPRRHGARADPRRAGQAAGPRARRGLGGGRGGHAAGAAGRRDLVRARWATWCSRPWRPWTAAGRWPSRAFT